MCQLNPIELNSLCDWILIANKNKTIEASRLMDLGDYEKAEQIIKEIEMIGTVIRKLRGGTYEGA